MSRRLVGGSLVGAVVVVTACSSPEPKPPPVPGGGAVVVPPSSGGAVPIACTFPASPAPFALPTANVPAGALDATGGAVACGSATFDFGLRDLDGDGLPDLVVDAACDDDTIGKQAWRVYRNDGKGFAASPSLFGLPQPPLDATCAKWTILDLDGDLAPDLVVTSLCSDASVGASKWLFYRNVKTGFDAPTSFALPGGFAGQPFAATEVDAPACDKGQPAYALVDVDGDFAPELVVTSACDDASVGTTAWNVYHNAKTGFASTPARFALPTAPEVAPGAYPALASPGACAAAESHPAYAALDLDGDRKIDLVVLHACDDATVGAARWLFYQGDGTGFAAAPSSFALPAVPGAPVPSSFAALDGTASCNGPAGAPAYTLMDVDGDFKPDLLVTRACGDPSAGVAYWLLYRNTGTSFAADAAGVALPDGPLGAATGAPIGLSSPAACDDHERPAFGAGYLVGAALDLVATTSCTDPTVGTTDWQIFQASCGH